MNQIFHIFKYKLITFIRLNSKFDFLSVLKNLGSFLIYGGFGIGSFYFSQKLIYFLLIEIKIGLFLLHELISIILFIFFLTVNIGNIIVAYSTLYKSNEVTYLFTTPLIPSKVFLIKFLDNYFYSSSTLFLILFSVLAGYAVYFKLNLLLFLLLFLFNFLPFIFSAGCLGVIILLIIIKLASKIGLKTVLYGLIASYIAVVFSFFKITSPATLANEIMKFYPFLDKDRYLVELVPPIMKYLPNNWLSESAFWIIQNDIAKALPLILIQIILALGLFVAAIYLGHKWYFDTWLKSLSLTNEYKSNRKINRKLFSFSKKSILLPKTESIIKKDLLLFIREPSQVIHLLVLLFLILVFVVSIAGIRFVGLGNYYLQTVIYLSVILFNLLLVSTLSLRFIFPILSLEGLAFWKIKSAPINNSFYMKRKLVIFVPVILIIGQILNYFANYRFGSAILLNSAIVIFFSTFAVVSINFGMGGLFVNYREKNAIRLASSQGATLAFLINIVLMFFIILFLFGPMSEYFLGIMLRKHFVISKIFYAALPIMVISSLLIFIFIKAGLNSLKKDF